MKLRGTTPVPNSFFDHTMGRLSGSAVRVYLKIIRNTYGWRDVDGNVKSRDWISHSQFEKVGLSNRSVTNAVEELLGHRLIEVSDINGTNLNDPQRRKKASKVFYAITENTTAKNDFNNAKTKEIPPQTLRSTKEISLPKYSADKKIPDNIRIEQIRQEQIRKQAHRDSWL